MRIASINAWDQQANREHAARERRARGKPRVPDPGAFDANDPRLAEARRRVRVVEHVTQLPGGMPSRWDRLAADLVTPGSAVYGAGPLPSLSTLQRWVRRWEQAGRAWTALIDLPSTGRQPKDIVGDVAAFVRKTVRAKATKFRLSRIGGRPRWERLTECVESFCAGKGLPTPSKDAIKRFVTAMGPNEVILAEFGTKAARAMVAPKAKNPTERPHELVFVDEVMLPTWIALWHDQQRQWVAARAWALFMIDAHSRAILACWVKKPDCANANRLLHTHATAEEVIAFCAGLVLPELAHPNFRTFARGEPGEFRLDGSGNTAAAARAMANQRMNATLGEANVPWTRGIIERYFQTLKERDLFGLTGEKGYFLPFDQEREDPRTTRTRDNADRRRLQPYRLEVPVEALGRFEHLVGAVLHAAEVYNDTPHRSLDGRTPRNVYEERAPRPAADAGRQSPVLSLFPAHRLTVEPRGVEARNAWYNCEALQRVYGHRPVVVRRDPLARGVYVYPRTFAARVRTSALFVPRHEVWAEAMSPRDFAKATREDYADRRAVVDRARNAVREEETGGRAARDARAAIAERDQAQNRSRRARRGPTITADGEDTTTTGRLLTGKQRKVDGRPRRATGPNGEEGLDPIQLRRRRLQAQDLAAWESAHAPAAGDTADTGTPPAPSDTGPSAAPAAQRRTRRAPITLEPPVAEEARREGTTGHVVMAATGLSADGTRTGSSRADVGAAVIADRGTVPSGSTPARNQKGGSVPARPPRPASTSPRSTARTPAPEAPAAKRRPRQRSSATAAQPSTGQRGPAQPPASSQTPLRVPEDGGRPARRSERRPRRAPAPDPWAGPEGDDDC